MLRGSFDWRATGLAVGTLILLVTVSGTPSHAAHNARMDVTPEQVEPGGEITVEGLWSFARAPVDLRWDSLDGTVLATVESTGSFGPVTVQVPNVAPGRYVLYATQDASSHRAAKGIPTRAQVIVGDPAPGADAGDSGTGIDVPRLAAVQSRAAPGWAEQAGVAAVTAALVLVIAVPLAIRISRSQGGWAR